MELGADHPCDTRCLPPLDNGEVRVMDKHLDQAWRDVLAAIAKHAANYEKHQQEMVEQVITTALEDENIQEDYGCYLHHLYLKDGE